MKREIKFRALIGKEFVYIDFASFGNAGAELLRDYSPKLEWQQFTGLKDKNGKEIYEGDIVECDFRWIIGIGWTDDEEYGFYQQRTWGKKEKILIRRVDFIDERYEVIGNIYEDELLTKGVKV